MKDLEQKITFSTARIREAEETLAIATPNSNKEKAAKKQLAKHNKLLSQYQAALRRAS